MHILFVDIDFHLKTRSADFFLELIRASFDVETHYYHESYHADIPQEKIDRADLVIVWQTSLGRKDFVVNGKPCVFIPMYDDDWGSRAQWKRIGASGTHVISFCDAISKRATLGGVPANRLLDLRFAYDPDAFVGFEGDPEVAAIWDRGFFGLNEFKRIFPPGFFRKLIVIRRPQPGLSFAPISEADRTAYNISLIESEFIPKEEYLQLVREPGVFLAPRPKEGIGMSFLEMLAMGKCVIAHNDATMNEYITDGKNGIVRDFYAKSQNPISREEIEAVRASVKTFALSQFKRWKSDLVQIVSFMTEAAKRPPVNLEGLTDKLLRLAYAVEAGVSRMQTGVKSVFKPS